MLKKRIIAAALALVLLLSATVVTLASTTQSGVDKYDYSLPSSTVRTVTAADLLADYLDGDITTAEREYLLGFSDTELKYSDGITTASIIAMPTDTGLAVRAHEYSYVASNGRSIVWIPVSARLFGEERPLTLDADGSYVTDFPSISDATDSTAVAVTYALDLTVGRELLDHIANYAYRAVPLLREDLAARRAEYERLLADFIARDEAHKKYLDDSAAYDAQLAAYNAWKSYDAKLTAYNNYINVTKPAFEAAMKAHLDSISARETYFAAQKAWQEFQAALAEYNAALAEHEAFAAEAAPYLAQLEIMAFTEQSMTDLGRTLYWAIHGTTVDSVLAQRDSLTGLAGVPDAVIDLAETSTVRLRTLLSEYVSIEGDAAKYLYYKQNYDSIRSEFRNLFVTLDFLYRNGTVRGMIKQMSDGDNDRNRKYQILLAQLFVMVNALWDEPVKSIDPSYLAGSSAAQYYKQYVYGPSFRIDPDHKYTVDQVLGGESYIADTDSATPLTADFPTQAPHPGDPPVTDLTDPGDTPPAFIPEPDEIEEVLPPEGEAPERTEHPGDPIPAVPPAGDPPTEYIPPVAVTNLLEIADSLAHREIADGATHTYTVTKTVEKRFINVDTVTVDFYDTDGITHLYTATVDRGTAISYAGPYAPKKAEDARAVYTFDGWMTEDGERIDLDAIPTDTVLYPYFSEAIKEYTVTWTTHSGSTSVSLPYGTTPVFDGDTSRPEDELYTYIFDGWDTEPAPVTGNAAYNAKYRREYTVPTTEGGARVTVDGDLITVDFRSSADRIFNVGNIVARAAGRYSVDLITRYSSFSFTPDTAESLRSQGACRVFLENSADGGRNYYTVVWQDSEGNPVGTDTRIGLTVAVSHSASDRLKLSYTSQEGDLSYASYTLNGHSLSLQAIPSTTYTLGLQYRAETIDTALAPVTVDGELHFAGDTVTVTVGNPDTVRVRRLYYRTAEGETVEIDGTSFVMPRSDVTVFAETEHVTYRITFMSDGHVLTTVTCKVGELPTLPAPPKKAADADVSYEFVGWSPEVSVATADAVYNAVYRAVPIEHNGDTGRGITLYMLINLAAAGLFGIFFIAIPATVMNVVLMRRFRRTLLDGGKNVGRKE